MKQFCQGTGTSINGYTFQQNLDNNDWFPLKVLNYLEENNIIISNGVSLSITDYDASCGTDVVIPKTINGNSVTTIGKYAFDSNQLTSVTIPDSVTIIGVGAFSYNQLTSVTIPNSVTTIGDYAFEYNQLTSVTIPDSVTTIEYGAFYNNQLTSVTIPNSVRIIYGYSFRNNNITEVTIPDTVEILACNAFDGDTIIHKSDSLVCDNSCQYNGC